MVTYDKYPVLLFTSYTEDIAPEELPFETNSEKATQFLVDSTGFMNLFTYIIKKNSSEQIPTHKNYFAEPPLLNKLAKNNYAYNTLIPYLFTVAVAPSTGTILFQTGFQYVYTFLDSKETKQIAGVHGRYISVAVFKQNTFFAFEEGILANGIIQIADTNYCEKGLDSGIVLLALTMIAYLSIHNNLRLVDKNKNKTSEDIYSIS